MGEFFKTDKGFSGMSQSELDRCAVEKRGIVGSIGYGFAIHDRESLARLNRFGWSCRVINTRGTGNCGTFVLIPTDARTSELARQGWIRFYQQKHGLSAARANVLSRAARGVARTHEDAVISAAIDLLARGNKPGLVREPEFDGGHRALHTWLDRQIGGCVDWAANLSFQRKLCALDWARKAAMCGWYDVREQ